MKKAFYLIIVVSIIISACSKDKLGKEKSLNGKWKGWMRGGTTMTMEVTLENGKVKNGSLSSRYAEFYNIVGSYQYDGNKFTMDFDNEASDFEGTGTSTELSGKRIVDGKEDGTFALEKE